LKLTPMLGLASEHVQLRVGPTLQMRKLLEVAADMTANDHLRLQPTRFRYATSALPKEFSAANGRDGPVEPMSRLVRILTDI